MEVTFQIRENYGNGCGGYTYFTTPKDTPISEIEQKAIEVIKEVNEKQRQHAFMGNYTPARPTIKVVEYNNKTNKTQKGGVAFTTKWR